MVQTAVAIVLAPPNWGMGRTAKAPSIQNNSDLAHGPSGRPSGRLTVR